MESGKKRELVSRFPLHDVAGEFEAESGIVQFPDLREPGKRAVVGRGSKFAEIFCTVGKEEHWDALREKIPEGWD